MLLFAIYIKQLSLYWDAWQVHNDIDSATDNKRCYTTVVVIQSWMQSDSSGMY